jgi:hypothetical protein
VTLVNPQQQSKHEIRATERSYEFVGVPPGSYVLTAEQMGFAAVKREGVVLTGQPFQQNVTMQVGSLQETITVMMRRRVRVPSRWSEPRRTSSRPRAAARSAATFGRQ